jgi:hypothetical protein
LRKEIVESKADLEGMGFEISNFILPYGRYGDRSLEMIEEHYDAIANYQRGGINRVGEFDPYRMSRRYLIDGSEEELASWMDEVARGGVIGLLGVHARHEELTADRIRTAIRMAKQRDVEIVTLEQALVDAGAVEPDRPTSTPNPPTESPAGGTPSGPAGTTTASEDGGGGVLGALQRLIDSILGLF